MSTRDRDLRGLLEESGSMSGIVESLSETYIDPRKESVHQFYAESRGAQDAVVFTVNLAYALQLRERDVAGSQFALEQCQDILNDYAGMPSRDSAQEYIFERLMESEGYAARKLREKMYLEPADADESYQVASD